jgi:uncharacterized membrane protein
MTSRWIWLLSRLARRIWFRATLFSVVAVATALLALVGSPYIPIGLSAKIGADAVDNILGIIASSMLTVTTFSLSTMVSAYSAATSNVTPRATRLVMEDSTTQNVLATFVGSFLFSLVGIIALSTGAYGDQGRLFLFLVTIAVIILIVVTLLRWIDHLSRLGRVTETTERVEAVTMDAMRERARMPHLGCRSLDEWHGDFPADAVPVISAEIGYVQHIDTGALAALCGEEGRLFVLAIPGDLVDPTEPIAFAAGLKDENAAERILACFSIGDTRSFDQDPRFGAVVLAEIASRALSPAVNDPGTAIDVITRALRILTIWTEPAEKGGVDDVRYPSVYLRPLELGNLFDDFFTPIARDGAGLIEVVLRLQKAFLTLSRYDDDRYRLNARRHSQESLLRSEAALTLEADKTRVRWIAEAVADRHPPIA